MSKTLHSQGQETLIAALVKPEVPQEMTSSPP